MFFNSNTRCVAYAATKEKVTCEKEFCTIEFGNSAIPIAKSGSEKEGFTLPAAAVAQGVSLGYSFLQDKLRERLERFVHQYHQRATNLEAGSYLLPRIVFSNFLYLEGAKQEGLRVEFEPLVLRGTSTFCYRLNAIVLNYAKAKTSTRSDVFDYTIQLTLYFHRGGVITERALKPMIVQSVSFGDNVVTERNMYSSPVPLIEDAVLIEAAITVVETNPARINTARVLKLLSDHGDKVRERITSALSRLLTSN